MYVACRAVPCTRHVDTSRVRTPKGKSLWKIWLFHQFFGQIFDEKIDFSKTRLFPKHCNLIKKILLRGYGLTKIRQKTSKIVQKYDEKCSFWLQIYVSHVEILILLNVYVPCRAVYVYTSHVDTFRGNSGWIQSSNWSFCLKTRCSADPLALRTFSQAAGAATSGAAVSHWPNLPTCLS